MTNITKNVVKFKWKFKIVEFEFSFEWYRILGLLFQVSRLPTGSRTTSPGKEIGSQKLFWSALRISLFYLFCVFLPANNEEWGSEKYCYNKVQFWAVHCSTIITIYLLHLDLWRIMLRVYNFVFWFSSVLSFFSLNNVSSVHLAPVFMWISNDTITLLLFF